VQTSRKSESSALSRPLYDGNTAAITPDRENDWQKEKRWLTSQLSQTRKQHASVIAVLTKHIATLEQQVNDLRTLYFQSLNIEAGQR
jgi:hypothetical protein